MNSRTKTFTLAAMITAAIIAGIVANGQLASAGGGGPNNTNGIKFNKKNFSDPLNIDNKYFPLKPGTTFFYVGTKEGEPQSDELIVTDRTKDVDGITARVVRDNAYENGKLVEFTDDWYAQDDDGNVWYMGEFTNELENGKVVSTEGSWEAGVKGGKPGIFMEANPQVGDTYQQEFAKGIAEDRAEIVSLTDSVCVPYGCFNNVLETKETTPLEPGVEEHKFFAPGVGDIKEQLVKGGSEILELTKITT
jgi:hypothetical protein